MKGRLQALEGASKGASKGPFSMLEVLDCVCAIVMAHVHLARYPNHRRLMSEHD